MNRESGPGLPQLLMRRPHLSGLPEHPAPDGTAIRPATDADCDAVAVLLSDAFGMEWTAGRVRAALTANPQVDTVYVATQGTVVLATASARLDHDAFPGSGYVHWVGTSVAARRQGLGRAVCIAVLRRFADIGCDDAVLETDDDRIAAIRLYMALGFEPELRHPEDARRWSRVRWQMSENQREA